MMASAAGWGLGKKVAASALGLLTGSGAVLAYEVDKSVRADMVLHPPKIQGCYFLLLLSSDTTRKVVHSLPTGKLWETFACMSNIIFIDPSS